MPLPMSQLSKPTEKPFWQVIGVFDPDGKGGDFAYTVGLASRGLPELHLWARPSEGHDPGHDWSFNPRERAMLLNQFAQAFLDGQITVGDEVVDEFDGGAATCTFRLDPPVAREELEAFQADPDARVVAIRWSLTRVPEGPLGPVDAAIEPRIRDAVEQVIAGLDSAATAALPARWNPTAGGAGVDLSPEQRYGPLTPLVVAYGAQVATADQATLSRFLDYAMLADQGVSPRSVLGLTAAAGRPVGRTAAVAAVREAVEDLVALVVGKGGPTRRWRDLVTELGGEMPRTERDHFSSALRNLFGTAVAALLATATVDDVLDDDVRLAGYGPWVWATCSPLEAPPAWRADAETLATARDLFANLTVDGLLSLADVLDEQFGADDVGTEDDHTRLGRWLAGQSVTGACGLPALTELLDGTPAAPALRDLSASETGDRDLLDVTTAAASVVVALARAGSLREKERTLLASAYANLLPELGAELERRAAADQDAK